MSLASCAALGRACGSLVQQERRRRLMSAEELATSGTSPFERCHQTWDKRNKFNTLLSYILESIFKINTDKKTI